MLAIELVSTDMLPYRCMEPDCGVVYKHVPAGYQVPAGAYSSGYCPEHLAAFEMRHFGRIRTGAAKRDVLSG